MGGLDKEGGTALLFIACVQALNSNSQCLQLMQQLFADIALKVDDRARGAVSAQHQVIILLTFSFLC